MTPVPHHDTAGTPLRPRLRHTRWCVVSGAFLGLALAACTALLMVQGYEHVVGETELELRNLATIVADQVDRDLDALQAVQSQLIQELEPATTGSEIGERVRGRAFHEAMRHKASGLPFLDALVVIDARGKLVASTRAWPVPPTDVSDRDYFKAFESDPVLDRMVTEPVRSRGTGDWTIYNARKIAGRNGEFIGLSLGAVTIDHFNQLFATLPLSDGSTVGLFRPDGLLITRRPYVEDNIGKEFRNSAASKIARSADRGLIRHASGVDGQERIAAVQRLAHHPAVIVATKTVDAALAGWRRAAWLTAGLALLIEVVIAGLVVVAIRQFRSQDLLAEARSAEIEARAAEAVSASALALARAELEVTKRRQQVADILTREHQADQRYREELRQQNARLAAALNNMSHGLAMFDANKQLVLCNPRYREIYRLPDEVAQPGTPQSTILDFCLKKGLYAAHCAEMHVKRRIDSANSGAPSSCELELADSRVIAVSHRPTADGGWVSVHEDMTGTRPAEGQLIRVARDDTLAGLRTGSSLRSA